MKQITLSMLFITSILHGNTDSKAIYLDLMKKCLTNYIYMDNGIKGGKIENIYSDYIRSNGFDWPAIAHTMIGLKRLDNIQYCVEDVLKNNIQGDLIETGVWRGGATIFMRAILKIYNDTIRSVWVADSFEGLPAPNPDKYPADTGIKLHEYKELAVSLDTVKSNFERYNLLDNQVKFLKGWFKDTLPTAPIDKIAVMRLDGDLYESTMDALVNLYPKLSLGGYVIIDDYGLEFCRKAVHDYRNMHAITAPIIKIDHSGAYWQKTTLLNSLIS